MATLSHVESRRMYSWWWDSHISPKNSKWLQENLTDMDVKVKSMIKLIEEDADSFARRAEMYYKKRPELMKMVEDFYRAYRALAERYDHATGVIRQAHRTMTEAFPNQVPLMLGDDSPTSLVSVADPRTFEMSTPVRALFESDELPNDASEFSSSNSHDIKRNESLGEESATTRKGLKQINDLFGSGENVKFAGGRARKGLNFHKAEENEQSADGNGSHKFTTRDMADAEVGGQSEEILTLKKTLAQVEAEKNSGLLQYQQSLDRLSLLESEISRAQDESKRLIERANTAEAETQSLKNALAKLEAEREANLLQYQECIDKISTLENDISHAQESAKEHAERADNAEAEARSVRDDLAKVTADKDTSLDKYLKSLEKIAMLENQLHHAEEDAENFKERAEKAEGEVEVLRQAISKLTKEKESVALQCQQCMKTISSLENNLLTAEEEAKRLNTEISDGVTKLKGAEEQCILLERSNQSLHSELESLMLKMGSQNQEITEKQNEMARLWTCIQEERLRFVEAETAFQTLQHLHAQTQEELHSLASDMQSRTQMQKDVESRNQSLLDEIARFAEENRSLNELNVSSAVSIKDMQTEISTLRETKGKLEQEVELRLDQRNALQQEIYCLRKELNDLNKRHLSILEQVNAAGLDPESLESSVKRMQDENSNLRENLQRELNEKVSLLEKLNALDLLVEKNALLENTLSDLSVELEAVKVKIQDLEESCQSLMEEKSALLDDKATLVTQLQVTNKNLEDLSAKNIVLENSLSDVRDELHALKMKCKILEDSYESLVNQKSGLASENESLTSQLETSQWRVEDLEKRYAELEDRCSDLEKERESALIEVSDLQVSLDEEKQIHANFVQMSETQLAGMESEMHLLLEECKSLEKRYVELEDRCSDLEKERESALNEVSDLQVSLDEEKQIHANFVRMSETRIAGMESEMHLLLEECKSTKRELNKELDESLHSQIMIFILQRCAQELEEKNFSMMTEYQELSEESIFYKRMISDLEKKNVHEQIKVKSLFDQASTLRRGLYQLLAALEIVQDNISQDKADDDERCLDHVLGKIEANKKSFLEMEEEIQRKAVEISILVTLLQQLGLELENRIEEKDAMHQEIEFRNEQLSVHRTNALKLQETNEELQSRLSEKDRNEEELATEVKNLSESLSVLQGNYQELKGENSAIIEEKRAILDELLLLQEKNSNLEEENSAFCGEALSLGNLSLIFKSCLDEKFTELEKFDEELDKLNGTNTLIKEKVYALEGNLEDVQTENANLKEALQKSEDELRITSLSIDKLNNEIISGRSQQFEKEMKLQEVDEKLRLVEDEKSELHHILEDLRKEHNEVRMIVTDQENHILKLSTENGQLSAEKNLLADASQSMEVEIRQLHEGNGKTKSQLESLQFQIKQQAADIDSWEKQAAVLFVELEISNIYQILYKEKIHELAESCQQFKGESALKDSDKKLLEERIDDLVGKNEDLGNLLTANLHAISSLKERISSLEKQTRTWEMLQKPASEVEDAEVVTDQSISHLHDYENSKAVDASADLQDLQTRIRVIERTVVDMQQLVAQREVDMQFKLEEAEKQIEELKSESIKNKRNFQPSQTESDNGLLTKDILLDQISDSSYGNSRRDHVGVLKSRVSGDQKDTIHRVRSVKKNRSVSSEIVEKELGVDKLEISMRSTEPLHEGNKRKVLERLNSDVQKLANLQITVQDLKKKLEISEKGKKGKATDQRENLREQLEEAENAVLNLFNLNDELMKNMENNSSGSNSEIVLKDNGSVKRTRVSEQAQRISEKIGRLQLEVQKIQFVLLKLDDEKGKNKTASTKRRVLLSDYLYGGGRTKQGGKRAPFCACIQPPATGD